MSGGGQDCSTILLGRKSVLDSSGGPWQNCKEASTAFSYLHQSLWGYNDGEVRSALWHSFRALSFRSFEVNRSVSLPFQELFSGSNFKAASGYCKTLRNTCTEEVPFAYWMQGGQFIPLPFVQSDPDEIQGSPSWLDVGWSLFSFSAESGRVWGEWRGSIYITWVAT